MFSIYINDLPNSCPKLNCTMYADDTNLYSSLYRESLLKSTNTKRKITNIYTRADGSPHYC